MKNFKEKSLKASNGITLIALVITIIVLLILAGISISMLSGDNSILQKATQSKEKTERAEIIENAKLDILAKITEKKGENLTPSELEEILTSNNYNTKGTLSNEESILDRTLTSSNGKYQIPVLEIYKGTLTSANAQSAIDYGTKTAETVELGDDITIGTTEKFKIIKKSPDGKTLTAIPYYNIELNTNNPKQTTSSGDNRTIFSDETYWVDTYVSLADIEVTSDSYILQYITAYKETLENLNLSNFSLRLATYSEMNESHMTNELRNPRYEWILLFGINGIRTLVRCRTNY